MDLSFDQEHWVPLKWGVQVPEKRSEAWCFSQNPDTDGNLFLEFPSLCVFCQTPIKRYVWKYLRVFTGRKGWKSGVVVKGNRLILFPHPEPQSVNTDQLSAPPPSLDNWHIIDIIHILFDKLEYFWAFSVDFQLLAFPITFVCRTVER